LAPLNKSFWPKILATPMQSDMLHSFQ